MHLCTLSQFRCPFSWLQSSSSNCIYWGCTTAAGRHMDMSAGGEAAFTSSILHLAWQIYLNTCGAAWQQKRIDSVEPLTSRQFIGLGVSWSSLESWAGTVVRISGVWLRKTDSMHPWRWNELLVSQSKKWWSVTHHCAETFVPWRGWSLELEELSSGEVTLDSCDDASRNIWEIKVTIKSKLCIVDKDKIIWNDLRLVT